MFVDEKVIVSGRVVEVYKYLNKPIRRGFRRVLSQSKRGEGEEKDESNRVSLSRSRKALRRLINANAIELNKFVTLTFAECLEDVEKANIEFNKFIKRLKTWSLKRECELKYIAVIEFQKRGAVHYHMLCNLPYIACDELAMIWKHGFVKVNQIDHVSNVGAYVSKYMQKEERDHRLSNKKMYFASRNLEKPLEFVEKEKVQVIEENLLSGRSPTYLNMFENEHVGQVLYMQYQL